VDTIIHFTEPTPSSWIHLQQANDPRMRLDGLRMVPDSIHLSFRRSIVEMCIWHSSRPMSLRCHGRSAGRDRMVRSQVEFSKRDLVYRKGQNVIPDSPQKSLKWSMIWCFDGWSSLKYFLST
jgi:hypothetical protein